MKNLFFNTILSNQPIWPLWPWGSNSFDDLNSYVKICSPQKAKNDKTSMNGAVALSSGTYAKIMHVNSISTQPKTKAKFIFQFIVICSGNSSLRTLEKTFDKKFIERKDLNCNHATLKKFIFTVEVKVIIYSKKLSTVGFRPVESQKV